MRMLLYTIQSFAYGAMGLVVHYHNNLAIIVKR